MNKNNIVDFQKLLYLSEEVDRCKEMVEDLDGIRASRISDMPGAKIISDITPKAVVRAEQSKLLLAKVQEQYSKHYEIILERIMSLKVFEVVLC